MAAAGLDLKNPGSKEAVVLGGGALLLALIYFAFQRRSPAAAASPSSGGAGPGGATGGVVPSYLLPAGTSGGAASATGNVFTDAGMAASNAGVPGSLPRTPMPAFRQAASRSETGQNILNAGSSSNAFVGAGGPAPAGQSGGGYVTYAQIFQALRAKGLSAIEATGILGNIQNESGGQVENTSGDAGTSIGLVQWHNTNKGLVTGNLAHDFANQVNAIVQAFHVNGVSGSTPQAVASSFAANFEKCQGCQPGQSQNVARQANAAAFYQQYLKGAFNPPKPKPKPVAAKGTKAATPAQIRSLFPKILPKPRPVARRPKPKARPAPRPSVPLFRYR